MQVIEMKSCKCSKKRIYMAVMSTKKGKIAKHILFGD